MGQCVSQEAMSSDLQVGAVTKKPRILGVHRKPKFAITGSGFDVQRLTLSGTLGVAAWPRPSSSTAPEGFLIGAIGPFYILYSSMMP